METAMVATHEPWVRQLLGILFIGAPIGIMAYMYIVTRTKREPCQKDDVGWSFLVRVLAAHAIEAAYDAVTKPFRRQSTNKKA